MERDDTTAQISSPVCPSPAMKQCSTALGSNDKSKATHKQLFPDVQQRSTSLLELNAELSHGLKSVVKIFTTSAKPNFGLPWQMHAQTKSTATGWFISPLSERRILTNAHAVADQVMVMVRKHGNAKKFTAKVLAVGHECDIAMLTVEEDEFWHDVCALELSELPGLQDNVTVVGFPTGGDNVCVTKGVVSRVDRQQYSHGRTSLLTLQIDAAINSGNSGGPVLRNGKVVGIAFQCLTSGENIGYIIPVPVVEHFLEDLKRGGGKYTGFCEMGVNWQSLENEDMKAYLRMPTTMTGVYVTRVESLYPAASVLKAGDVITHIEGVELADDGTFLFREAIRIDFRHLVSMKYDGELCRLKVWSDGQHQDIEVQVCIPKHLVPIHSHDQKPTYFIYAGLVFTRLTVWYLRSIYGNEWQCKAPIKLYEKAIAGSKMQEDQEVVILSKVLAADVNNGYQDVGNIQVLRVNGQEVNNLAHLGRLLTLCNDAYIKLDLEWHKALIINQDKAKKVSQQILEQNSIPHSYSKGLLEENMKKAARLVPIPASPRRQVVAPPAMPSPTRSIAVCSLDD